MSSAGDTRENPDTREMRIQLLTCDSVANDPSGDGRKKLSYRGWRRPGWTEVSNNGLGTFSMPSVWLLWLAVWAPSTFCRLNRGDLHLFAVCDRQAAQCGVGPDLAGQRDPDLGDRCT